MELRVNVAKSKSINYLQLKTRVPHVRNSLLVGTEQAMFEKIWIEMLIFANKTE